MNIFTKELGQLYQRDLERLRKEIGLYPEERLLWEVLPGTANSGGHLCQHLIGNLTTYIGQALGGHSYVRDREAEFDAQRFSQQQLDQELQKLALLLEDTFGQLDDTVLSQPYPRAVLDLFTEQTVLQILLHLLGHLSYHTGQINYHRRSISAGLNQN